jgi:hypothetical protein
MSLLTELMTIMFSVLVETIQKSQKSHGNRKEIQFNDRAFYQESMERKELMHQQQMDRMDQIINSFHRFTVMMFAFLFVICILLVVLIWALVFLTKPTI